jgi:hypothetical protein
VRPHSRLLTALLLLMSSPAPGSSAEPLTFAIASVRDRTADPQTSMAIAFSLETQLLDQGRILERNFVRDALRKRRIRRLDNAAATELSRLGSDLGADWLLALEVHEAHSEPVPTVTLSLLAIPSESPLQGRSAFSSSTAIDGLHVFGLGEVWDLGQLAELALTDLLEQLDLSDQGASRPTQQAASKNPWPAALGRLAVLPLTSNIRYQASDAADVATQALVFVLQQEGADLVSPNQLAEVLRQRRARRWGEVDQEVRSAIYQDAEAKYILTGAVEEYNAGLGSEPRPDVTVALRALDAETGRIVWTGALERDGWFRQSIFRQGRIYSRGDLLTVLLRRLTRDFAASEPSFEGIGVQP